MRRFSVSQQHCLMLRRLSLAMSLVLILLIFSMADSPLATGTLNFTPPLDKVLHASVYGSIAALLWFSGSVRSALVVWLLVIGLGVLDELHQRSIAGRESSISDLLADVAGVSLGLWMATLLLSRIVVKLK